jgi:hypothetical protein
MNVYGPSITYLTERLIKTPEEFLMPPVMISGTKKTGKINTGAVISDLLFDTGGNFLNEEEIKFFELDYEKNASNYLNIVLIICYLFHDNWFQVNAQYSQKILKFLKEDLFELANIVNYELFVTDSERREELARLCLYKIGLIPEGENENIAADRLITLNSIERRKIIEGTRAAYLRAQKIREAIAKKAAEEAASKMSRE